VALDYFSNFSLVLDLLRAKIIVADFSEMNVVLGILAAYDGIVIVSVKNRTGIFIFCIIILFLVELFLYSSLIFLVV
jgi:hypothetical protein